MYAAIESLVPNKAFTIFTGDVVEGAVWLVTGMLPTALLSRKLDAYRSPQTPKSPTTSKTHIPA
jgi:hypothetical protein